MKKHAGVNAIHVMEAASLFLDDIIENYDDLYLYDLDVF
jgi:hypothetical protein